MRLFRFTRFGLATRAAAENEKGAVLLGLLARLLAGANWVLSTVLAALFGILAAPVTALDPTTITLLIVPALGAALVGSLSSFGSPWPRRRHRDAQAADRLRRHEDLVPASGDRGAPGVAKSLPFLVIVLVLFLRGDAPADAGRDQRRAASVRADATPRPDARP